MKRKIVTRKLVVTVGLIMVAFGSITAQVAKNSDLFLQLKKQDSVFFERAFNLCDMEYLKSAVDDNLVFYHDQGGIQDKAKFLLNTQNNICATPNQKPIRKVDSNSLEVFPLYNNGVLYGVVQTGIHHFFIREPQKEDRLTSSARFTHVWLLKDGRWLLKEVLSFDHVSPAAK